MADIIGVDVPARHLSPGVVRRRPGALVLICVGVEGGCAGARRVEIGEVPVCASLEPVLDTTGVEIYPGNFPGNVDAVCIYSVRARARHAGRGVYECRKRAVPGAGEPLSQEARARNDKVRPGHYSLCIDAGGAGGKTAGDIDSGEVPVRRAQKGMLVARRVKEGPGYAPAEG